MKNFFVRTRQVPRTQWVLNIFYLALVLSTAFAGCRGPLEPLREAMPRDKGRVVIRIGGDTDGGGARTIAPGTGVFTKYTLTFSGPADHDPVDLNGDSVAVDLTFGSWTIGALGYTGTDSNYAAVAEGSAELTVVDGEAPPPVSIILGPKSTAPGTGSFNYSITVPGGVRGSLYITTAEGGAVDGGTIVLGAGTTNTGSKSLAPGQYLARLRLEKGGVYAGFTEALHVYSGLTSTLPDRTYTDSDFPGALSPDLTAEIMAPLTGVWYSHDPGIGRLDGYRIGRWEDFDALMTESKLNLFPDLERSTYTSQTGGDVPGEDDFFVFYDDTVYGQNDDGTGGNGGWEEDRAYRYIGIVRAVNTFAGDPDRGAIIVEYLKGCAPAWDDDIKDGQRPFFGIYYKKTDADTIQLANAVDLDAMYLGEKYYTETATLQEAIDKNTAENDSAFIVWGVVIPQEREQ